MVCFHNNRTVTKTPSKTPTTGFSVPKLPIYFHDIYYSNPHSLSCNCVACLSVCPLYANLSEEETEFCPWCLETCLLHLK